MFQILQREGDKGKWEPAGDAQNPLVFETGKEAQLWAKDQNEHQKRMGSNVRFRCQRITDPNNFWRKREKERFASGHYTKTPWHDEPWYQEVHGEHFCHMSRRDEGKVSYTPDEAAGQADRQTRIAPGRYLAKHFGDHLTAAQISRWASKADPNGAELKFASTAREIIDVYLRGPDSCMAKDCDEYASEEHPVCVYGDSDLQVAYLWRSKPTKLLPTCGDPDCSSTQCQPQGDGHIVARCLVWPKRKVYGRCYGDYNRLQLALQEEGYHSGGFSGARIRRVEDDNEDRIIAPYIDTQSLLSDCGDGFLRITDDRSEVDYNANDTVGWAAPCCVCPNCRDWHNTTRAELTPVKGSDVPWCGACLHHHAFRCADCGEQTNTRQRHRVERCGPHGGNRHEVSLCDDCYAKDRAEQPEEEVEAAPEPAPSPDWVTLDNFVTLRRV